MALDRRKGLQNAERLLKQGKVQAALSELQRVSESAPNDLLTLNRLGDLLARQGRHGEAIDYYRKIAEQFAAGGFFPKASAIHKKILRLDPQNLSSLVALGQLYLDQNLQGEARNYLLHAANLYLESQQFDRAREVYRRLADAEPEDPRHRVRLAETRAAQGETDGAAAELVELADELIEDGQAPEAQKILERAAELAPDASGPAVGLARCLSSQGFAMKAMERLEAVTAKPDAPVEAAGELAVVYASTGRPEAVVPTLSRIRALDLEPGVWLRLFRAGQEADRIDAVWDELDPLLSPRGVEDGPKLEAILDRLATLEKGGHVPALERAVRLREQQGDRPGQVRYLERLERALRQRGRESEASAMATRLTRLRSSAEPEAPAPEPEIIQTAHEAPAPGASKPTAPLGPEVEAPSVPLSKADEEFVTGRLTQAEVLERYGLKPQALEQIQEVTERFPGHLKAQESRVALLRDLEDAKGLADALADLAVASRASGNATGAREAAGEAGQLDGLSAERRARLEACGLLADGEERTEKTPPAEPDSSGSVDLVIDFDEAPAPPAPAAAPPTPPAPAPAPKAEVPAPPVAAAGPQTRVPSPDMLEEIRRFVDDGDAAEARKRIAALETLGYAGEELERLAAALPAPVATPPPAPAVAAPVVSESSVAAAPPPLLDEELSEIAEALESELFAGIEDEDDPIAPEAEAEESVDEIFASFRQAVKDQVSDEDYRTHYDLGIGYKEMGLVDEAIEEFRQAASSDELHRQSCTMVALCYQELANSTAAVEWYRKALVASGETNDSSVTQLRYDLACVLLESGDTEAALGEFRHVLDADPSFRDVRGRVDELEAASNA